VSIELRQHPHAAGWAEPAREPRALEIDQEERGRITATDEEIVRSEIVLVEAGVLNAARKRAEGVNDGPALGGADRAIRQEAAQIDDVIQDRAEQVAGEEPSRPVLLSHRQRQGDGKA
jgi:hypothetical protein